MVTRKYGVGQIVETAVTPLATVALSVGLRLIKTPFDDLVTATLGTENTIGPTQFTHRFKALGVIDQILDIG